jgi:hypothetical protein
MLYVILFGETLGRWRRRRTSVCPQQRPTRCVAVSAVQGPDGRRDPS